LYVDGMEQALSCSIGSAQIAPWIGSFGAPVVKLGSAMPVVLDDVRLYDFKLSASQVVADRDAAVAP
jgi:hypothetical protein